MAQAPPFSTGCASNRQFTGQDWLEVTTEELPLGLVASWAVAPQCGALVLFAGTVRDHSEGRAGVVLLEYEAYESAALQKMAEIAAGLRRRWPVVGKLALLHRTGPLRPTDTSVLVAVSAPHRAEAFEAARCGIDAIKSRVPIWKRETWEGGADWSAEACQLEGLAPSGEKGA